MNIWFMYDNHTFAKIIDLTQAALIARAKDLFRQDGCGSLYVHDESGTTIGSLTLHGRRRENGTYGVSEDKLRKWAVEIEAERSFRTLMV